MKQILIAFLILSPMVSNAQAIIEKNWGAKGYDIGYSAAATNDGGYIITGLSQSSKEPNGDIILIKVNQHADTMWTRTWGGPNLEGGNYVLQTSDGGYLISGHTEDYGARDCDGFLMKLDAVGTQKWLHVYGGEEDDISEGVVEVPGEGYVMAGITASFGYGTNRHAWFFKTNYVGDTVWTHCYGGHGSEYATSIVRSGTEGYFAVGYSTSFNADSVKQGWLFKLNNQGDTAWTRLYPSQGNSRYYQIIPSQEGGYMIAGYTEINHKQMGLAIKLNVDGSQSWEKTFPATKGNRRLSGVAQLPNNNYIFSGTTYEKDSLGNAFVLTISPDAKTIEEHIYGNPGTSTDCIAIQGNDSYLLGGNARMPNDIDGNLYYLLKDNKITGIPAVHDYAPYLYPVPCNDHLTIMVAKNMASLPTDCSLYNLNGQEVMSSSAIAGEDLQINTAELPDGLYSYRINSSDSLKFSGTVVVKH